MNIPDEYIEQAKRYIDKSFPVVARSRVVAEPMAEILGYQAWRKTRVYDHMEIEFGVRMHDGTAGYLLKFREGPDTLSKTSQIALSEGELRDLVCLAQRALKDGT